MELINKRVSENENLVPEFIEYSGKIQWEIFSQPYNLISKQDNHYKIDLAVNGYVNMVLQNYETAEIFIRNFNSPHFTMLWKAAVGPDKYMAGAFCCRDIQKLDNLLAHLADNILWRGGHIEEIRIEATAVKTDNLEIVEKIIKLFPEQNFPIFHINTGATMIGVNFREKPNYFFSKPLCAVDYWDFTCWFERNQINPRNSNFQAEKIF